MLLNQWVTRGHQAGDYAAVDDAPERVAGDRVACRVELERDQTVQGVNEPLIMPRLRKGEVKPELSG